MRFWGLPIWPIWPILEILGPILAILRASGGVWAGGGRQPSTQLWFLGSKSGVRLGLALGSSETSKIRKNHQNPKIPKYFPNGKNKNGRNVSGPIGQGRNWAAQNLSKLGQIGSGPGWMMPDGTRLFSKIHVFEKIRIFCLSGKVRF